ncbi:MAG: S41 family peptidase [Firmicutes bacterium]|nr:S41 family peptidase [Bacillota bacterium]
MKKYFRWLCLIISFAVIIGVLFLKSGPAIQALDKGIPESSEASRQAQAQAAFETLYILKTFYLYPVDELTLLQAYGEEEQVRDMIKALDDPLARFMSESEFRTFIDDMKGSFDGIGIVVGIVDGELTVVSPIKNTPGERAGLLPMDKIKYIDNKSTEHMALEYAVSLMKGEKGTAVILGVERIENDTVQNLDISIMRDTIQVPHTSSEMLDNKIGYVHLASFFGENVAEEMMENIRDLLNRDMEAFILDLRLNTGGSVHLAVQVLTKFLPAGTPVVHMVDKSGHRVTYNAGPGEKIDIPMVVLVNEISASASEIVAGALKDTGRAILVGVKTFGKGSVQTIYPLSDGSAISITTHKYLTAGEHLIDKKGIEPDVIAVLPEISDDTEDNVTDTQLEAAIKVLEEQLKNKELSKHAG